MGPQTSTISVTRRLVERYLMFGLACVFVCVSLALVLAWRGHLPQLVELMALPPLAVLLIGALVLRRTLRCSDHIERQLIEVATTGMPVDAALRPLIESEPMARGWNAVLEQLRGQQTLRRLESRLQESLEAGQARRCEAVLNRLSDGIAVTDGTGQVVLANNALLAVLGATAKDCVLGRTLSDLLGETLHAPDHPALAQLVTPVRGRPLDVEHGSEETERVLRITCHTTLSEQFDPDSTLWSVRDVTQQKLAERMRDQFVNTVAHELRTPLANLKAYAETLVSQPEIDLDQQNRFYNVIQSEATRLARFVDELLNVSQMEAGAISISRHETDTERLLLEIVQHIRPLAEQKVLQFEQHLPLKLPKLQVDKDKLSAALINLLGNAVKYTPAEGKVRLLVELGEEQVHFHVEDTGIGIAADELPRISEKFFRSRDQRVRRLTGSGLGLAFAREVARLHGGKLSIRSEIDKGSRFSLTLPLS